jgi:hypothetical protein
MTKNKEELIGELDNIFINHINNISIEQKIKLLNELLIYYERLESYKLCHYIKSYITITTRDQKLNELGI